MQVRIPEYTFNVSDVLPDLSEDCLYLNIYRPVTKSSNLPVMVWFHGGGFYFGGGSQYDGTELSKHEVIVVTVNYRLNIFGFMSNEDDVIPGNYGMLDLIMALKWVKNNIKEFGGNPDMVTIFGESAGSASVSFLILSPLAKGLFKRAIMESGVSLSHWALFQKSARIQPSQAVKLVGAIIGCTETDTLRNLECFRKVDAEKLLNASNSVHKTLRPVALWPPIVENVYGFLPDHPVKLWEQNKFNHVDTIRGYNKLENGLSALFIANFSVTLDQFKEGYNVEIKPYVMTNNDASVQNIIRRYVGNDTSNGHYLMLKLVDAESDRNFIGPTFVEANMESSISPEKNHYVYQFDYSPSISIAPAWLRPVHGDELKFVFGVNLKEFQAPGKTHSKQDVMISQLVQELWTSFAKFGNPTMMNTTISRIVWDQYKQGSPNVLHIDVTSKQHIDFKIVSRSTETLAELQKQLSLPIPSQYTVKTVV